MAHYLLLPRLALSEEAGPSLSLCLLLPPPLLPSGPRIRVLVLLLPTLRCEPTVT